MRVNVSVNGATVEELRGAFEAAVSVVESLKTLPTTLQYANAAVVHGEKIVGNVSVDVDDVFPTL